MITPTTIHNSLLNLLHDLYPNYFKKGIREQKIIPIILEKVPLHKKLGHPIFYKTNSKI